VPLGKSTNLASSFCFKDPEQQISCSWAEEKTFRKKTKTFFGPSCYQNFSLSLRNPKASCLLPKTPSMKMNLMQLVQKRKLHSSRKHV
jgi:hypothetical protein